MLNALRLNTRRHSARKNPVDPEVVGVTALAVVAAGGTALAIARRRAKGLLSAGGQKSLFGEVKPNWAGYYMGGAHKGREFGNWQSDNAWDIFAKPGTPVYAITPGTVGFVVVGTPPTPSSKVYGDRVQVKSSGGMPDVYYTHIKMTVSRGQPIKVGDLIGHIVGHDTNPKMPPHVHIGLDQKRHIKEFVAEDGTLLAPDAAVA